MGTNPDIFWTCADNTRGNCVIKHNNRHHFDYSVAPPPEYISNYGLERIPSDHDPDGFGVWAIPELRTVFWYEGETEVMTICKSTESFNAEVAALRDKPLPHWCNLSWSGRHSGTAWKSKH